MILNDLFLIPNYISLATFEIVTGSVCIVLALCLIVLIKNRSNIICIYMLSLISSNIALLYFLLDAPDVAMTEAAIGAAISTVILISFIKKIGDHSPGSNYTMKYILGFISGFSIFCVFIYIGTDLPVIGNANNPIHMGASKYYISHTSREVGIPSFVAAILASYRGFDTLGETTVIMLAATSVAIILGIFDLKDFNGNDNIIVKQVNPPIMPNILSEYITKIILPCILMLGAYIQIFGEISPGGGFQAGAILATSFIGYDLTLNPYNRILVLQNTLLRLAGVGVLIYALVGLVALAKNNNFLNYYNLLSDTNGQTLGIMMVELGVGVCVTSVMIMIYQEFK